MGDSVYEKDGRRIRSAIDALRAGATHEGDVWDWGRSLVPVDMRRREVYSYGQHFPLFRYVPRSVSGRRDLFVINGDEVQSQGWGNRSRTPDHQSTVRAVVSELGADSVVIPFSALAGAGIDLDSIRPVHVRPDAIWTETVERAPADTPLHRRREYARGPDGQYGYVDVAPDDDGLYRWTETRHRLGDCLFSAVREETFVRPARPFEVSSDSARESIQCPAPGESYCHAAPAATDNRSDLHEAGPSGACVHCGRALQSRVTRRRRARFLSSFDYQELAPLYFLVQVPRGAGDTVEAAIESLAPRAVHAARARGIQVERQGDIFFVATRLTDIDLELRGIVARARLTQWDRDARARKGEVGYVAPLDAAGRRAMQAFARAEFQRIFRKALLDLTLREAPAAGPRSKAGARAEWSKARARHAVQVERARAELRSLTFGRGADYRGRYRPAYVYYRESQVHADRRSLAERIRRARAELDMLETERAFSVWHGRVIARDAYRAPFSNGTQNAAVRAWIMAVAAARARFMPEQWHGPTVESKRARVREVLAVYGTAHTAREVVRVRGGAVYVKGRVSHRPELDPAGGRDARPDHAPLDLAPDTWYLAIRNRVPRSRSRA